ncbi:MAG TPA: glycosyltransferase family 39 protein, partial [Chloroflexota bacterium]|nr:glycosyltransferase family 39 protein [Chloroflexota bacterium]
MRTGPAAALLGVVALLLMAAQLNPYLGDFGDDAEFLILGQGLARGQGYAWVNTPDLPPHNRYPPGYPLLLAATLRISGTADDVYRAIGPAKVATAACFLVSLPLLWLLARRRLPPWWAVGAVALFALDPVAIRFAVQVMSDLPYVPLLLAALLWAESHSRSRRAPDWVVLGALLAAGAYVRSIGLPAAGGVLAWAWLRRERRPGAFVASVSFLACMLPWWLRDAALAGGWRYLEELTAATYLDPDAGTVSAGGLVARALDNAAFVLGKPAQLGPFGILAALAGVALLALGA